jgi:hypothetical protein
MQTHIVFITYADRRGRRRQWWTEIQSDDPRGAAEAQVQLFHNTHPDACKVDIRITKKHLPD